MKEVWENEIRYIERKSTRAPSSNNADICFIRIVILLYVHSKKCLHIINKIICQSLKIVISNY